MKILNADCEKIAVENPVNIISGNYIGKHFPLLQSKYEFPIKPTQTIQPYEYGNSARKKTCLWLKGLPKLVPTNIVSPGEFLISSGKLIQLVQVQIRQEIKMERVSVGMTQEQPK